MAKPLVRLRVVEIALGAALLALVLRAAQVQLVEGHKYAAAAKSQRTERVVLEAVRLGDIVDDLLDLSLIEAQENPTRDPFRTKSSSWDRRSPAVRCAIAPLYRCPSMKGPAPIPNSPN